MTDDANRETQSEKRSAWSGIPVWTLGLFALYVLSTGPIVKLMDYGLISYQTIEVVYAPLIWASDSSDINQSFFEWCIIKVWGVNG